MRACTSLDVADRTAARRGPTASCAPTSGSERPPISRTRVAGLRASPASRTSPSGSVSRWFTTRRSRWAAMESARCCRSSSDESSAQCASSRTIRRGRSRDSRRSSRSTASKSRKRSSAVPGPRRVLRLVREQVGREPRELGGQPVVSRQTAQVGVLSQRRAGPAATASTAGPRRPPAPVPTRPRRPPTRPRRTAPPPAASSRSRAARGRAPDAAGRRVPTRGTPRGRRAPGRGPRTTVRIDALLPPAGQDAARSSGRSTTSPRAVTAVSDPPPSSRPRNASRRADRRGGPGPSAPGPGPVRGR